MGADVNSFLTCKTIKTKLRLPVQNSLLGFVLLAVFSLPVRSVGAESEIKATPNRPGVANPPDTTQVGVLEYEFGWARGFRSEDFKSATNFSNLFRFGLLEDVELRFSFDSYLTQQSAGRNRRSGFGDTSLGFKYRLLNDDDWPTLAFAYEVKIPTASQRKGLGSGRVDHNLSFLSSKELWGLTWSLSYFLTFQGEEKKKGFDDAHLVALSFSRDLFGPVGFNGEFYGGPGVHHGSSAFARTDWALTFTVLPRLIFDIGVDAGLNAPAPNVTYFAGMTVALADMYSLLGIKK
jgi:hypothetical protein